MTASDPLKILYGYISYRSPYEDCERLTAAYLRRLCQAGFDVKGFCLTLNPPGPRLHWPELDARWRRGDRELMTMYEQLVKKLEGRNVFVNGSGINLHPEFVRQLPVFRVFQCCDDPESSDNLSRPVAHAYDLCVVNNIAEVETYRRWGVKRAHWIPLGFRADMADPALTYDQIISGDRDVDVMMIADRLSPWRAKRMDVLHAAFPNAHFYGQGWPCGYLDRADEIRLMGRSKIGPNVHNSTGPINLRTFYLPANGVMQICDNKRNLGAIYELNRQVVGFDTIEECVELCRYYLAHDAERRQIAAEGWKHAVTEYNEIAIFKKISDVVVTYRGENEPTKFSCDPVVLNLIEWGHNTRFRRWVYNAVAPVRWLCGILCRLGRGVWSRILAGG